MIKITDINYDKLMQEELNSFSSRYENKPEILIHSCCGPCSSYVLEYLAEISKITVFFFNPNISPDTEYGKRFAEQKRLILEVYGENIKIIEGDYDNRAFYKAAAGFENEPEGGVRCQKCFELRLNETAKLAAELKVDYFTSTLSVSPHKNAFIINSVLEAAGKKYGAKPLCADFKKRGGYRRSTELSRQYGLYRQNYCGCKYSLTKK